MADKALEKRAVDAIARVKFPADMEKFVPAERWIRSLLLGEKYTEPDPNFLSRMLAAEVIFAGSVEEVFKQGMVQGLQKLLPDKPNAKSATFELESVYVMESDFTEGNPCYVVMRGVFLDSGEEFITTTGATGIQAQLISLIGLGQWPIRAVFMRGDTKDAGGHYLMFLSPAA